MLYKEVLRTKFESVEQEKLSTNFQRIISSETVQGDDDIDGFILDDVQEE